MYRGETLRREKTLRKVQLTGGATLIVSLPKAWAKSIGLSAGDYVAVLPQPDGSLIILPESMFKEAPQEATIVVDGTMEPETVVRYFIAYYLAGYNLVKIKFEPEALSHKRAIKKVIKSKLVGAELIEESTLDMAIQFLVDHTQLPALRALMRMSSISKSMIRDSIEALVILNRSLAEEVIARDDEVDKFYLFLVRQLKMAVKNSSILSEVGFKTTRDCLGYRIIAKSVERIADHAQKIASMALKLEEKPKPRALRMIISIGEESVKAFEDAMKSVFELDMNLADEVIRRVMRLRKLEAEAIEMVLSEQVSIRDASNLRLALDSLFRIAEYAADISEIVINMAIKSPREAALTKKKVKIKANKLPNNLELV